MRADVLDKTDNNISLVTEMLLSVLLH